MVVSASSLVVTRRLDHFYWFAQLLLSKQIAQWYPQL